MAQLSSQPTVGFDSSACLTFLVTTLELRAKTYILWRITNAKLYLTSTLLISIKWPTKHLSFITFLLLYKVRRSDHPSRFLSYVHLLVEHIQSEVLVPLTRYLVGGYISSPRRVYLASRLKELRGRYSTSPPGHLRGATQNSPQRRSCSSSVVPLEFLISSSAASHDLRRNSWIFYHRNYLL